MLERAGVGQSRLEPESVEGEVKEEAVEDEIITPLMVADPFTAAVACFDEPPKWPGGPDLNTFEPPSTPALDQPQRVEMKRALVDSTGIWNGLVVERVCLGKTDQAREEVRKFSATLESIARAPMFNASK